jgi:hypothetical protein
VICTHGYPHACRQLCPAAATSQRYSRDIPTTHTAEACGSQRWLFRSSCPSHGQHVFSGGSRGWTYGHSWRGLQALHAETFGDPQVCIAVLDGPVVVAAVGNDGCACLQVPSAVPSVLAVGAWLRTGLRWSRTTGAGRTSPMVSWRRVRPTLEPPLSTGGNTAVDSSDLDLMPSQPAQPGVPPPEPTPRTPQRLLLPQPDKTNPRKSSPLCPTAGTHAVTASHDVGAQPSEPSLPGAAFPPPRCLPLLGRHGRCAGSVIGLRL